jgi:hypothetical protein
MRWAIGSYRVLNDYLGFIDVKKSLSGEILVQPANIVSL